MKVPKIRASIILADSAQVSGGKLYLLGGGWDKTDGKGSTAIGLIVEIPLEEIAKPHKVLIELLHDEDKSPFLIPTPDGDLPLQLIADFSVELRSDLPHLSTVNKSIAVTIAPLPGLQAGKVYEWRCSVDGEQQDSRTFLVVAESLSS